MIWPETVIETLQVGVAAGLTGRQIAERISDVHGIAVTRNAVIGKIARLGLKSLNKPVAINKQVERKLARQQKVDPKSLAAAILQLGSSDCRWPGETTFCGQLARPGFPYCAEHCQIAYVKGGCNGR